MATQHPSLCRRPELTAVPTTKEATTSSALCVEQLACFVAAQRRSSTLWKDYAKMLTKNPVWQPRLYMYPAMGCFNLFLSHHAPDSLQLNGCHSIT